MVDPACKDLSPQLIASAHIFPNLFQDGTSACVFYKKCFSGDFVDLSIWRHCLSKVLVGTGLLPMFGGVNRICVLCVCAFASILCDSKRKEKQVGMYAKTIRPSTPVAFKSDWRRIRRRMPLQRSIAAAPLFSHRLSRRQNERGFGWDEGAMASVQGPRVPCFAPSLVGRPAPPALLEADPRRRSSLRRAHLAPPLLQAGGHRDSPPPPPGARLRSLEAREGAAEQGKRGPPPWGAPPPPPSGVRCIHPPSILSVLLARIPRVIERHVLLCTALRWPKRCRAFPPAAPPARWPNSGRLRPRTRQIPKPPAACIDEEERKP
jgi:hypothetical protein